MLGGSGRSLYGRIARWYTITIIINFVYVAAITGFAFNLLAIRLDDPEGDRWKSFNFWKFGAPTIIMIFPLFFFFMMLLYNYRSIFFTLHFWITAISAGFFGVLIGFMIVDWTNCSNVVYCVHPTDSDRLDFSFVWAFVIAITIFGINVAMLFFNGWLKKTVDDAQFFARNNDEFNGSSIGVGIDLSGDHINADTGQKMDYYSNNTKDSGASPQTCNSRSSTIFKSKGANATLGEFAKRMNEIVS